MAELTFTPLPLSQAFVGELCFKLESCLHLVQARFEAFEQKSDGENVGVFDFVRLLSSLLLMKRQSLDADMQGDSLMAAWGRRKSRLLSVDGAGITATASNPDAVAAWIAEMGELHVALATSRSNSSDTHSGTTAKHETFLVKSYLEYCLCSMFFLVASIIADRSGVSRRVCRFHDVRTFVLDVLLAKGGGASSSYEGAEKGQCGLAVQRTEVCKALYHAERLTIFTVDDRDRFGRTEKKCFLVGALRTGPEHGARIRILSINSLRVEEELTLPMKMGNVTALLGSECTAGRGSVRLLFVATADYGLRAFDLGSNLRRQKLEMVGKAAVTVMASLGHGMAMSGDANGMVRVWKLNDMVPHIHLPEASMTSLELVTAAHVQLHRGTVTACTLDHARSLLFTAGLDYKIVEYNLRTLSRARILSGHRQFITAMCYSAKENVLVSASTEYKIFFWPLEMLSCTAHAVDCPAQRGALCLAELPETSQCVAMDERGVFTVWNARLFQWSGFIACEPDIAAESDVRAGGLWTKFVSDPVTHEIICHANRKVYYLTYSAFQAALHPTSAHDASIAKGVSFDESSSNLLSCAGDGLHVWDLEQARTRHCIAVGAKASIMSMLFLQEEGILILGLDEGNIMFLLTTTFRRLAEYSTSATDAIVDLCHLPHYGSCVFAALSAGGQVLVLALNTEINECHGIELVRKGAKFHATALHSLRCGRYVLVGEVGNCVSVWHLVIKKSEEFAFLNEGPPREVCDGDIFSNNVVCVDLYGASSFCPSDDTTAVCGVPPGNIFVSGDAAGKLHLWAFNNDIAWPLAHFPCRKFSVLLRSVRVTALCVFPQLHLLYVGDSVGGVAIFDLSTCIPVERRQAQSISRTSSRVSDLAASIANRKKRKESVALALEESREAGPAVVLPPMGTLALSSVDIRPVQSWDAHPEASLQQILVLPKPYVLITISTDCDIQMWYLGGTPIGYLLSPKNIIVNERAHVAPQEGIDFSAVGRRPSPLDASVSQCSNLESSVGYGRSVAGSSSPTRKERRSSHLVSFLTDFQFGDVVEESGTDAAAQDVITPGTALAPASRRASTKDSEGKDPFLHRYNDLPPPYGLATVAMRKNTMMMLRNVSGDGFALPDDMDDAGVLDDAAPMKLLRSVSSMEIRTSRGPSKHEAARSLSCEPTSATSSAAGFVLMGSTEKAHHQQSSPRAKRTLPQMALHSPALAPAIVAHTSLAHSVQMNGQGGALRRYEAYPDCNVLIAESRDTGSLGTTVSSTREEPVSAAAFREFCANAMKQAQSTAVLLRGAGGGGPVSEKAWGAAPKRAHRLPVDVEASIASRRLPPSAFPSAQRLLGRSDRLVNDSAMSSPSSWQASAERVPDASPQALISVTSPSRMLQEPASFKTMGEATTRRYHEQLYRPVELPTLRQPPCGVSFSMKKKPSIITRNHEEIAPQLVGVMSLVSQSPVAQRQQPISSFAWNDPTPSAPLTVRGAGASHSTEDA